MIIQNQDQLRGVVWNLVHGTPVVDMHTHLYDARFSENLLWGMDELLTYHYLIAEANRFAPNAGIADLEKREQAELVWQTCFLENSPVSEAARGVLTTLGFLGLDPASRNLGAYRKYFETRTVPKQIDDVLTAANVKTVVMTNNPFNILERDVWTDDQSGDARFKAALRLDGLILDWKGRRKELKQWNYEVKARPGKETYAEVRRFLNDWVDIMKPLYMALSLPHDFDLMDKSDATKLIHKAVLPVCRELNMPLALMIGTRPNANPALGQAGHAVAKADLTSLLELCRDYPHNRFLVTCLSRENQHELCVLARKFETLMPFGCWWFLNDPTTIDEMTRMRLELLGMSFVAQHSDARVLEQLLYKWAHTRWILGHVLQEKYSDLWRTGWRVTETEIERDVTNLLGGNFLRFLKG